MTWNIWAPNKAFLSAASVHLQMEQAKRKPSGIDPSPLVLSVLALSFSSKQDERTIREHDCLCRVRDPRHCRYTTRLVSLCYALLCGSLVQGTDRMNEPRG